ncbi:zinc finger X-chromosomal protein-like [Hippocampus comes]|uniref:zinc finger X-chromosomal protein-like n=1 Tax=Hippocampus comes TaxID=109280 RepID=UPI00094F3126|nr:PREDICTED: zinc finger X-chromosomal protein-like [Hippocampus comes]XP_019711677.1 PREDICTED: zinc finger X-chromosomal protein-like [Hippocampus comes]
MKRGSSALQPTPPPPPPPPPDVAQRHTQAARRQDHVHADRRSELCTAGLSPFLAATSLFSPDVNTKMASDLLIRLSEATQKSQMLPGSRGEGRGGQQEEPGLALSPDGPGASPDPPSLTHTPEGDATTDTLASDLLRKLAESQFLTQPHVKVKEEEASMEIDTQSMSGVFRDGPIRDVQGPSSSSDGGHRLLAVKKEHVEAEEMADPHLDGDVPNVTLAVKVEEEESSAATLAEQILLRGKMEEETQPRLFSGVAMEDRQFFGDQLCSGAKMAEQCLRAALWQDMSVNLASTLLHQLSERVAKSTSVPALRTNPPTRRSPVLKAEPAWSCPSEPAYGNPSSPRGSVSFFYRCHVCGFETDGRLLFRAHMTEHRQQERGSFSLRCCVCDHATNQEAAMKAHADKHVLGGATRCPLTLPAGSAPTVATATLPETITSEHRCRICQRSFPGQPELLVHFQGHRQGNQYRCERCGHLTRTANKLVEHVRVHTGERPFTCHLCPYSAKRRDSLRLHCKVKHGAHATVAAASAAHSPGNVHTHRSYVHGDNPSKHVRRLHTSVPSSSSSSPHLPLQPSLCELAGWRDLSPLVPITTLLSLKPHSGAAPCSLPSSSSSSNKHSFLGYLGLTSL